MPRPVWVEVDLDSIRHNYNEVKRLVGTKVKIMAIVKADAYGHGAVRVAKSLVEAGADCFGVAIMKEAMQLRRAGLQKPILILGWTPTTEYLKAARNKITLSICSYSDAEILSQMAVKNERITVHLKIDTGMGRIGIIPDEPGMKEVLKILALPGLDIQGIFTHLAKADEKDKVFTKLQLDKFNAFTAAVERKTGYVFPVKHAANSAAILDHPEAHFDMVRPGIMLYGLYPSEEVHTERAELQQALSWRARISQVKRVPPNFPVSYGGIYKTSEESVIATLPLGYADGYSRILSGRTEVIFGGQRVPVVGRICMDQMMINVTAAKSVAKPLDQVTLIGRDKDSFISVDEIARVLGTINYEVVCNISKRVPRMYIRKK